MKNLIKAAIIIAVLSNTVSADSIIEASDTWGYGMNVEEGYAMALLNAEVGTSSIVFYCGVDTEGCEFHIWKGPECTKYEYYLADVTSNTGRSINISLLCAPSGRMWVSSGYTRIMKMMKNASYISMKIHADEVQTLRFSMIGSSKALDKVSSRYDTLKEIDHNRLY